MSADDRDGLLEALADLPCEDPNPARSRAILASAARTLARGRRRNEPRFLLAASAYANVLAPVAAAALSAAFIVSAVAQATAILVRSGAGVFLAP